MGVDDSPMDIDFTDSLHPPTLIARALPLKPFSVPDSIRPLRVNIDDREFQRQLKRTLQKNKINIPFVLAINPPDSLIRRKHLITFQMNAVIKHNKVLSIDFPGLNIYILRDMVTEILLSVGIIIIASISFILLIKTIYRQKQFAEMKNDFISNITHELKTPVSIMMATNEALVRFNALEDKEKTKRYLAINRDELNKLQSILNNIVRIFKHENLQQTLLRAPFDINISLQNIVNRFSCLDQVKLHYKNGLIHPVFSTNEEAVETIVTNLIDNAIKYNDQLPRQVWIECRHSETGITISVSDNGTGIEKQYLPFVFDKFYRVPQGNLHEVKGFGLGLSHVKQLVKKLNGAIELQSQPGKGSHFIINLPSDAKD
jgi:signal transduction histidine kinase